MNAPTFLLSLFLLIHLYGNAQGNYGIQWKADIPSICTELSITMQHDSQDRPYLYVANKEAGLTVYNISNLNAPTFVASVPISLFSDVHVINLTQKDQYVYLACGNIWAADSSGMVIVDVSDPSDPIVSDFYILPNSTHGSGIVAVEGNYAYLGAMQDGLITLDVSDKNNIQFVSQFVPDVNFPINNPNNLDIYNLRGMEVRNNIIYACYDGGGIRIIDVTNKAMPQELGRYCNPVMYTPLDHPKAYNNIVLNGSLAYVAVDYCGVEVLNIADPADIQLVGWWNPYGCPNNNWFTSPVHANEIRYNPDCGALFLSTGKSDLFVLDVSDPTQPDSVDFYGGVNNSIGTWGVNYYQNELYLSYICVPWPGIPFSSNWTGVKILSYENCTTQLPENSGEFLYIFPNPAQDQINIQTSGKFEEGNNIILSDLSGKIIREFKIHFPLQEITMPIESIKAGMYYLQIQSFYKSETYKIRIE